MMRTTTFWKSATACCGMVLFAAASVQAAELKVGDGSRASESRAVSEAREQDRSTTVEFLPLPGGLDLVRVVDGEESATAAGAEQLLYSNTAGDAVLPLVLNNFLADDITLNTSGDCPLRRYSFKVRGKANLAGVGGAFRVDYALFNNCPGAGGQQIAGTVGSREFSAAEADAPVIYQIEFVVPENETVNIPPTVWLGIRANRANVGLVFGAPALLGFSQDLFDFPLANCNAEAGGFPEQPHASYTAEVYGDAACAAAFPGYRNIHPGRSGFSDGPNRCIADDIQMLVPTCTMTAMSVEIRNTGVYRFDMRSDSGSNTPGAPIPNTTRNYTVRSTDPPGAQVARFTFDPPIALPGNLNGVRVWVTMQGNNPNAGWILTRKNAEIGNTASTYGRSASGKNCTDVNDWVLVSPTDNTARGAFDVTVFCQGTPPLGACCDMHLTNDGVCDVATELCVGGEFNGQACLAAIDCKGSPKCKQLPRMNCSFPPLGVQTTNRPTWQAGQPCPKCQGGARAGQDCNANADCPGSTCSPLVFGAQTPCGVAACCTPDDQCVNLTEKACQQLAPPYEPNTRSWQIGRYCGVDQQSCPRIACLGRSGECTDVRTKECTGGPLDDQECDSDSQCRGFCGVRRCVGGLNNGNACTIGSQCPLGSCQVVCSGGTNNGLPCVFDSFCNNDLFCTNADESGQKICIGGLDAGEPCQNSAQCRQGGTCTQKICQCENPPCEPSQFDPVQFPQYGTPCTEPRQCRGAICQGSPGCENPICCTDVCNEEARVLGSTFCCDVTWDEICAQFAAIVCDVEPSNDRCEPRGLVEGARLIPLGEFAELPMADASTQGEPGFCCHNGFPPVCNSGDLVGESCEVNADCYDGECVQNVCIGGTTPFFPCGGQHPPCGGAGVCGSVCLGGELDQQPGCASHATCNPSRSCIQQVPLPGQTGENTVWYRFDTPPKTQPTDPETVNVEVTTCRSNQGDARDSLIQVFASALPDAGVCEDFGACGNGAFCDLSAPTCADGTRCLPASRQCNISLQDCPLDLACVTDLTRQCNNLVPLGCNDDSANGCGETGRHQNSRLCLSNLPRQQTYYIEVAHKFPDRDQSYRVDVTPRPNGCGPNAVPNDGCPVATLAADGVHPFSTVNASFDCPPSTCLPGGVNDVWFRYVAPYAGTVRFETCGASPETTPDTEMSVYRGCSCPTVQSPREPDCCSGFTGGSCGDGSRCNLPINPGDCFLVRVADRNGVRVSGNLTVTTIGVDCNVNNIPDACDLSCASPGCGSFPGCGQSLDCNDNGEPDECELEPGCCPNGPMTFLTPASGTVDARWPIVSPFNTTPAGITQIQVQAPEGAGPQCFELCETPTQGPPNGLGVLGNGDGTYSLTLNRPPLANTCTTIRYLSGDGAVTFGSILSHPGNVNGDASANSADIQALVNYMNNVAPGTNAPWGLISADINRSGLVNAMDLVGLVDQLNGGGALDPANNTNRPSCVPCEP